MGGKFKSVIYTAVGLMVVFQLIVAVIPGIQGASANVTAMADIPAIISTMANLWWIPIALILIAVVTSVIGGRGGGRGGGRRFRRRRR